MTTSATRQSFTLVLVAAMMSLIMSLGAPLITTVSLQEHVSLSTGEWMLTITLLVGALATPIMGRLADGRHQRLIVLATLAVVFLGLVVAAVSRSFVILLVGRGLQGMGLGLVPVCMTIARTTLPPAVAERTIATLSITAAVGVGIGYPMTSVVAQVLSFHDSFWLAAVLVALTWFVAAASLPDSHGNSTAPFDTVGAASLIGGLSCLLLLLGQGQVWGWGAHLSLLTLLGSVVLLGFWVVYELKRSHPLVELRQLRNRTIAITDLVGAVISMAMYLFIPIMVEFITIPRSTGYGFGASVLTSGLLLVPLSAATFLASRLTPWLSRFVPRRFSVPLGATAFALAALFFTFLHGALWEPFVASGMAGLGVGLSFAIMPSFVVASVPPSEVGAALGFYQLSRNIGLSVGSALAGLVIAHETPRGAALPPLRGFTLTTSLAVGILLTVALLALLTLVPPAQRPSPHTQEVMAESAEFSATGFSIETEGFDE